MQEIQDTITTYLTVIRKNTLFEGMTEAEIRTHFQTFSAFFKAYDKGEILNMTGTPLTRFGLVVYGCVEILTDDMEGNRTIMAEVVPGNTFGESLCFLKTENPDIYISASENAGVFWLSPQKLFSGTYSEETAVLEKRFAQMIAKRTLAMNHRIQILSKLTLRDKIMTYFTFLAKNSHSEQLTVPFNREDMAAYIGTNRSALSRELSVMKKEGIIEYHKNSFRIHVQKHL